MCVNVYKSMYTYISIYLHIQISHLNILTHVHVGIYLSLSLFLSRSLFHLLAHAHAHTCNVCRRFLTISMGYSADEENAP